MAAPQRTAWLLCLALTTVVLPLAAGAQEDPAAATDPARAAQDEARRLLRDLSSGSWEVREQATQELLALVRKGAPVVPLLTRALDTDDPEVEHRVRRVLEATGHHRRPDDRAAAKAESLLGRLALRPAANWDPRRQDEPAFMEWDLAEDLAEVKGESALAILATALTSDQPVLRRNVAFLLGRIGSPHAAPALAQALSDPDAEVRAYALFSLAALGDAASLPAILEMPEEQPTPVRLARMIALERLPDPAALRACLDGLRDPAADVRFHACFTLRRWTGLDFGFNAWHPDARRAAALAAWEAWWQAHGETFEFPDRRDH
ncbi:MAG: HEAT repeat domain-containing protein [Planctomycetes bacterium]|nr:HEAT repeat domain-containing protein [Planctomycetota bacterium]